MIEPTNQARPFNGAMRAIANRGDTDHKLGLTGFGNQDLDEPVQTHVFNIIVERI